MTTNSAPVITSTPISTTAEDSSYSYLMTATDGDSNPLIWSVTNGETLPSWLSFSSNSYGIGDFAKDISNPGGMTSDPDGNTYVISKSSPYQIYKIAPDGTKTNFGVTNINGVALSMNFDNGNLYVPVGSGADIGKIFKYDSNGEQSLLATLSAVKFGPSGSVIKDGYLYVANAGSALIQKISLADGTVNPYKVLTYIPSVLAITQDGVMYVGRNTGSAQSPSYEIVKYTSTTNLEETATIVTAVDKSPTDLKIDTDNNLYVATSGAGLFKYTNLGTGTKTYITSPNDIPSILLKSNGEILMADATADNNKVVKLQSGSVLTGTPTNSDVGVHTVKLSVTDGIDTVNHNFTITVTNVNDAPTGLGNLTLATIDKNADSPAGAAISALTGLDFVDVDAGSSLGGVAVVENTANSATQGVWQYSTNSGTNWHDIGSVSAATALVLSSSTWVRFLPVTDYTGTPPSLTVRALDNTYANPYSLAAGIEIRLIVNAATNGGTTAISANTNTISTSVSSNKAPTISDAPTDVTVTEDVASDLDLSAITFADADNDNLTVTLTVVAGSITASSSGNVEVTGSGSSTVTLAGSATDINTFLDTISNIKYTSASNASGNDATTLTISAVDANGRGLASNSVVNIDITPVNDAPTISSVPNTVQAVTTGIAAQLADFTVADVDGDKLTITLQATNGRIGNLADADPNAAGIQLAGVAQTINAALANATFIAKDAGSASIDISVSDGTESATASYLFEATAPISFSSNGTTSSISSIGGALGNVIANPVVPADLPSGIVTPFGQISFTVDNVTPGGSATITLEVDKSLNVDSYYKKNLVTNEWTKLPAAITTTGDVTMISFSLEDGGPYDSDRVANGKIVDPGVLAQDLLNPTIPENSVFATNVSQVLENSEFSTLQGAISYALNGGDDAAKFTIDSQTGVLKFITPPDFENPTDTGTNNSYSVNVRVTGANNSTVDKTLVINVSNDAGIDGVIKNLAGDAVSTAKNTAVYVDAGSDVPEYADVDANFPSASANGYLLVTQTGGATDGSLGYHSDDWTNLGFNSTTKEFTFTRNSVSFVGAKIDAVLNGENGKALKINFLEDVNGLLVSTNEYLILLQYLQYQSATVGERTFSAVLSNGSEFSEAVSFSVNVTGNAPVLQGNPLFGVFYKEHDAPVAIAKDATITDADDTNLKSLVVKIRNLLDGADEKLTIAGQDASISANYDPTTGTMTLSGVATLANYQAALRLIKYENSSENPNETPRTLEIVAIDESLQTTTVVSAIEVAGVNDAPTLSGVPTVYHFQNIVVGQAAQLVDFKIDDVDNTNLTVTLTATNGTIGGVIDDDTVAGGIQVAGTIDAINTRLVAATFTATNSGAASIGISVTDGIVGTPTTATYNLTATNSPPPPADPEPTLPAPVVEPPKPEIKPEPIFEKPVLREVEMQVPSASGVKGDGNGDGIADVDQKHVISLPTQKDLRETVDTPKVFLSIELPQGLVLTKAEVKPVASATTEKPLTFTTEMVNEQGEKVIETVALNKDIAPFGLFEFNFEGVPSTTDSSGNLKGGTADVKLYLDDKQTVEKYLKQTVSGAWKPIPFTYAYDEKLGKTVVSISLTDGDEFDLDGGIDGKISDPGTPIITPKLTAASETVSAQPNNTKIFVGYDRVFKLDSGAAKFFGQGEREVVELGANARNVIVDQNIEHVKFTGVQSDYSFEQKGNSLQVSKNNVIIAQITVQDDANGSLLTFANSTQSAQFNAGKIELSPYTVVTDDIPRSIFNKASVFTAQGETIGIDSELINIYGSNGYDAISLAANAAKITIDQNVERVNFSGKFADYRFAPVGNTLEILVGATQIASVNVQDDSDGTQFIFVDGEHFAKFVQPTADTQLNIEITGVATLF